MRSGALNDKPDRWRYDIDRKRKKKEKKECYVECKNGSKPNEALGIVGVGYGIRNIEERLTRADLTDAI